MADCINDIRRELEYRKKLLKQYEEWMRHAPEGRISTRRDRRGNNSPYHQYTDRSTGAVRRKTIEPGNSSLLRQMKLKGYIAKCIPRLKRSIRGVERALNSLEEFDPLEIARSVKEFYADCPLMLEDISQAETNAAWENLTERQNTLYPERLRYQGPGGMYRSKSEMIIATQLARFEIPFKYEPGITVGASRFYPDFLILNPNNDEIVYWEHLGLLDKSEYQQAFERKISTYCFHGIRPGDNLILTCEGEDRPLSSLKIERTIRAYLL